MVGTQMNKRISTTKSKQGYKGKDIFENNKTKEAVKNCKRLCSEGSWHIGRILKWLLVADTWEVQVLELRKYYDT